MCLKWGVVSLEQQEADGLITTMFFKDTYRNYFIPLSGCHHSSWLKLVPKRANFRGFVEIAQIYGMEICICWVSSFRVLILMIL